MDKGYYPLSQQPRHVMLSVSPWRAVQVRKWSEGIQKHLSLLHFQKTLFELSNLMSHSLVNPSTDIDQTFFSSWHSPLSISFPPRLVPSWSDFVYTLYTNQVLWLVTEYYHSPYWFQAVKIYLLWIHMKAQTNQPRVECKVDLQEETVYEITIKNRAQSQQQDWILQNCLIAYGAYAECWATTILCMTSESMVMVQFSPEGSFEYKS